MTSLEIPDVNVLLAIVSPDHIHHQVSRGWFLDAGDWGTCSVTENGLLRLLLNPAVMGQVLSVYQATEILKNLRAHANHKFLSDTHSLLDTSLDLGGLQGHKQVTDFHLLSLAQQYGGKLVTLDKKLVHAVALKDRSLLRVL